jgi:hypothetical protein
MKFLLKYILILFTLINVPAFSQTIPQDAWLWTTFSLEKKITQKTSVFFEEELRFFDNDSRINLFFSNLGVDYQLNKNFKLSLVYRFINKNQDDAYFSKRHRLYVDFSYKQKLNDFAIVYRIRFQGQVRDVYSSEYGRVIESYMRHKIDIKYNYKRFTPYVAAEFRFQINNPDFQQADDLWNRMRLYAGSDYKINRQNSVGIYYMIQQDFNNKRIERDFTLGFQYSISL